MGVMALDINGLSAMRRRALTLPVPGMVTSPFLHPLHLIGSAEGVAVTVFAEPSPLAGGLAGVPASGLETVLLTIGVGAH